MYRRLRSEKKDEWREGKEKERAPLNHYRYVAIQTCHIGVDRGARVPAMELLFVLFMAAVIVFYPTSVGWADPFLHPSDLCVDSRAVAANESSP